MGMGIKGMRERDVMSAVAFYLSKMIDDGRMDMGK